MDAPGAGLRGWHAGGCAGDGPTPLFNLAALAWLRRPEAWSGALLAAAVCSPGFIVRLTLGRPYLFTMAVFVLLLLIWTRLEEGRPGGVK